MPQIFEFIDRCGLRFGRWVRQAPYLPQCGALAKTAHSSQLAQLPDVEQYAAVELFRGTMVSHSFLVYRDNQPGERRPIKFDDNRWLEYVPIRLPETIIVQKNLPPGAVAVLINKAHTYPDQILPVDAEEKRLFDAIDGKRNIEEIIHGMASQTERECARTFFECLWWYDQVVFEVSKTITTVEM